MYNDDGIKVESRYTVIYDGYLFDGDSTGTNMHGYDRWADVEELINHYGEFIEVADNEYGVRWKNGEWY